MESIQTHAGKVAPCIGNAVHSTAHFWSQDMNIRNRKSLVGLVALSAAMAMPLAFAQEAQQVDQTQPPAEEATGAATQQPAQSAATGSNQSWSDLDIDGNGTLSLQEAQANSGLVQIFEHADSNADGQLSTDEYKAYVETQQSATPQPDPAN